MKICPWCEAGYPDELTQCPLHGGILSEIRDLKPGMLVRGTYRIVRKLNQGGMGDVYLARQILLGELQVLKFLSNELSRDQDWTSRFLREVKALRQIRHKNVVQAGNLEPAEDGTLFFSMEYVDGPDLLEFYRREPKPFDVALALDLIWDITSGLGAAHAAGVVHRDIKPENILIAWEGDILVPKIADFGIVATREESRLTTEGTALLTPQFAAPEQWLGTPTIDLDGRTDFYALGGVLFELLTGRCAFQAENYQAWALQHLNTLPARPSSLRPELKEWRGLDQFVMRLLAKNRSSRPMDAAEVHRLLSEIELEKHSNPNKSAAVAADELDPAPHASDSRPPGSSSVTDPVPAAASGAAEEPFEPPASRTSPAQPVERETPQGDLPVPRPSVRPRTVVRGMEPVIPLPSKARPLGIWLAVAVLLALIGFGLWHVNQNPLSSRVLLNQHGAIFSVAFSPNGLNLASASSDHTIQFWDVKEGRPLGTLNGDFTCLAFSPDGHSIATGMSDHTIDIWDVARSVVLATLQGNTDQVSAVAFSPNGATLASGGWDSTVRLWDVNSGNLLATLRGAKGNVMAVAFSPDGKTLASAGADQMIRLWNVESDEPIGVLRGHSGTVNAIAYSPGRHTLASASNDGAIGLWDPSSHQLKRTFAGHGGAVLSLAFSPNGTLLASAGSDKAVRLWNTATGQLLKTLTGPKDTVLSVAFSPFGSLLASGSADKSIRLWALGSLHP